MPGASCPQTACRPRAMNVLVFNAGSNSLKFDVIDAAADQKTPTAGLRRHSGVIDDVESYGEAAKQALEQVAAALGADFRPDRIAHRVVHGGDQFNGPVSVDETTEDGIEAWQELAPLHNGPALEVIRQVKQQWANVQALAVFDTAFHQNIPRVAWTYALPIDLATELRIRRYGFHGFSHQFQLLRYAELNQIAPEEAKLVTLHLESGSSAAAISNGHSVDTSMGFTPLEGLVMGSRCGDLDPAIVSFLARKRDLSLQEVERILNHDSGLLGLSGISNDTRVLVRHLDEDRARLALEVFSYRVRKYVAAYLAVLEGPGAIIFSGGIGENTPFVRTHVCTGLRSMGVELDEALNESTVTGDVRISLPQSRIPVWVIHSDEALMIAHEAVTCS